MGRGRLRRDPKWQTESQQGFYNYRRKARCRNRRSKPNPSEAGGAGQGVPERLARDDLSGAEDGKIVWQKWIDSDVMSAPDRGPMTKSMPRPFPAPSTSFKQKDGAILSAQRSRATQRSGHRWQQRLSDQAGRQRQG